MQSNGIVLACAVCNAPFTAKPSRIAAGLAKFCSRPCYWVQKRNRTDVTCATCGDVYAAKPVDAARGRKFCSEACYLQSRVPTEEGTLARFWKHVNKTETCWLWMGSKTSAGYGNFMLRKTPYQMILAHRLAWQLANNRVLLPAEFACHRCDTPTCIRPDHIFISDHAGNMRDMAEKGHTNATLTSADVIAMRERYARGSASQRELAREYGVSTVTANAVIRRRTWKHVP